MALTPCIFFRQFFFLLDYFIISVSLALEITFHVFKSYIYSTLAGLLVLIRLWRFVRVAHGIAEVTNEMAHKEYDGLVEYTGQLEELLKTNNIEIPVHHDSGKKWSSNISTFLEKMQQEEHEASQAKNDNIE